MSNVPTEYSGPGGDLIWERELSKARLTYDLGQLRQEQGSLEHLGFLGRVHHEHGHGLNSSPFGVLLLEKYKELGYSPGLRAFEPDSIIEKIRETIEAELLNVRERGYVSQTIPGETGRYNRLLNEARGE